QDPLQREGRRRTRTADAAEAGDGRPGPVAPADELRHADGSRGRPAGAGREPAAHPAHPRHPGQGRLEGQEDHEGAGRRVSGRRRRGGREMTDAGTPAPLSFYEEIGGHDTFVRLVDAFYRGVAGDEVLKPMYPEDDLRPAAERLTLFLEQYWGGPSTYSERRGHPRLRMRHASFHVNPD